MQAERDTLEQTCLDLQSDLATARHQLKVVKGELLANNDAALDDITAIDGALKDILSALDDNIQTIADVNKIASLSYSLEVAKSSKKAQERELKMLRTENDTLKNENKMLLRNFDHAKKERL